MNKAPSLVRDATRYFFALLPILLGPALPCASAYAHELDPTAPLCKASWKLGEDPRLSGLGKSGQPSGNQLDFDVLHYQLELFPSFEQFAVWRGETATFSSQNLPFTPSRVLARVTSEGLDPARPGSTIDGTLRCEIAGADLFLLNPWGISFRQEAVLDGITAHL